VARTGGTEGRPGLHTEFSLQNLLENVQLEDQEEGRPKYFTLM
jgi:hypothetical protein